MGLTVVLNANAMVRSTVKFFLVLSVMVYLSWELTVLTCIEIPLVAIMQHKYINVSTVGGARANPGEEEHAITFLPEFNVSNLTKFDCCFLLCVQTLKNQIQDCCAQTENLALQTVKWIKVVRSFQAEKQEMRRYSEAVSRIQTLRRRQQLYSYLFGFLRNVR